MSTVILLAVLAGTFFLGKYALEEGRRIEQQNQLMKNMNEYERKYKKVYRRNNKRKTGQKR